MRASFDTKWQFIVKTKTEPSAEFSWVLGWTTFLPHDPPDLRMYHIYLHVYHTPQTLPVVDDGRRMRGTEEGSYWEEPYSQTDFMG